MNLMDIYLHKPSGVRYALVRLLGDAWVLHGISCSPKTVSIENLENGEVWQKC